MTIAFKKSDFENFTKEGQAYYLWRELCQHPELANLKKYIENRVIGDEDGCHPPSLSHMQKILEPLRAYFNEQT